MKFKMGEFIESNTPHFLRVGTILEVDEELQVYFIKFEYEPDVQIMDGDVVEKYYNKTNCHHDWIRHLRFDKHVFGINYSTCSKCGKRENT